MTPSKLLTATALFSLLLLGLACDDSSSTSATDSQEGKGQGTLITADPDFTLKVSVNGQSEHQFKVEGMLIFEAKPGTDKVKEKAQTFELSAEHATLTGVLPEGVKISPNATYADMVGKTLVLTQGGGDPQANSMSRLTVGADKVYDVQSGTMTIDSAFYKKGAYAGVSGKVEMMLQELKLGDSEDPKSKGDQKVGEPVKATATFNAKAKPVPFEKF